MAAVGMEKGRFKAFSRYIEPAEVDPADWIYLDQGSKDGTVEIRYMEMLGCNMARLTDEGLNVVIEEELRRNPLKRLVFKYDTCLRKAFCLWG